MVEFTDLLMVCMVVESIGVELIEVKVPNDLESLKKDFRLIGHMNIP